MRDVDVGMHGMSKELPGLPFSWNPSWVKGRLMKGHWGGYKRGGACMPLFPCLTMGNYEWPGKEIRLLAADTEEPLKVLERRKDQQKLCSSQRAPGSGTERTEE